VTRYYASDELATMLRAAATGLYTEEAAVELLIAHDVWLLRRDFVARFVVTPVDTMARVLWREAADAAAGGKLPSSPSALNVLRVAASISGGSRVDLGAVLTGLDAVNTALVVTAIRHATGHHTTGDRP
jgi:hypothetical protein